MISEAIKKIVNKEDLTYDESYMVMNEIMDGATTATQNAAFLAALSTKSTRAETIDEICGCALAMREHARTVTPHCNAMELVGTGGDGSNSFNISTTSAFVVAAAGVPVAKHGNRAASSATGAADCLEALGVTITQSPALCEELLRTVGMCFMFAQAYHSSMKYVAPIRKELGVRTVFNILGPLTNPAHPTMQLLGVYDEYLVEPLAQVLIKLGVTRGMVVYGKDGMDELSISAPSVVCEITNGTTRTYEITPEEAGLKRYNKNDIRGGNPQRNAQITRDVLDGKPGAYRDATLLNAGAALVIAGKAATMAQGAELAAKLIDTHKAQHVLDELIEKSAGHVGE